MGRWILLVVSVVLAGFVLLSVAGAALSPEAQTPPGAEGLAEQVRTSFWKDNDVRFPPFRTVLARWEIFGPNSYIVEVQVYDLLFGPFPKRGLVTAACWSRTQVFHSGWLDVPGKETELRSEFLDASKCAGPPSP